MRRWLTLLLLVTLPLQFTWAAAAAYCQHEQAPSARHMGHHEHEHPGAPGEHQQAQKAQKAADPDATKAAKVFGDADCGYCQLSAAKPLQVQGFAIAALAGPPTLDASVPPLQTRDPDRRERPNWCLA
jgi:hypothetical protein